MKKTRFTLNSFIFIIMLFSALYLFITVDLYDMSDRSVTRANYPIGDTGYYVRYSSRDESGISLGDDLYSPVILGGYFGYDWGAAICGDWLYCNEYKNTRLGFTSSDLVRIRLSDMTKEVIAENAMLRGRCSDGSLLCYEGVVTANWFPQTNPLYSLYAASDGRLGSGEGAFVHVLDPSGEKDLELGYDPGALSDEREAYYLERGLVGEEKQ